MLGRTLDFFVFWAQLGFKLCPVSLTALIDIDQLVSWEIKTRQADLTASAGKSQSVDWLMNWMIRYPIQNGLEDWFDGKWLLDWLAELVRQMGALMAEFVC